MKTRKVLKALAKIQKMCRKQKSCKGCVLRTNESYGGLCLFTYYHISPSAWELEKCLDRKGESNDG